MAGSSPPPALQRRRRAAPVRGDWKTPEGIGWQHGRTPSLSAEMEPATRHPWQTWMASWFAALWTPEDLPGLRVVAAIYDAVERGNYTRASELRLWMDNYGITPSGQQACRWLAPDAKPPSAPSIRPDDAHLSVKERFGR